MTSKTEAGFTIDALPPAPKFPLKRGQICNIIGITRATLITYEKELRGVLVLDQTLGLRPEFLYQPHDFLTILRHMQTKQKHVEDGKMVPFHSWLANIDLSDQALETGQTLEIPTPTGYKLNLTRELS